ncbi:MAG TPA: hypothetical protein VK908_04755 [Jiangellales bacterium]|nr:hypothetical protein [Jiangellales bacterium]
MRLGATLIGSGLVVVITSAALLVGLPGTVDLWRAARGLRPGPSTAQRTTALSALPVVVAGAVAASRWLLLAAAVGVSLAVVVAALAPRMAAAGRPGPSVLPPGRVRTVYEMWGREQAALRHVRAVARLADRSHGHAAVGVAVDLTRTYPGTGAAAIAQMFVAQAEGRWAQAPPAGDEVLADDRVTGPVLAAVGAARAEAVAMAVEAGDLDERCLDRALSDLEQAEELGCDDRLTRPVRAMLLRLSGDAVAASRLADHAARRAVSRMGRADALCTQARALDDLGDRDAAVRTWRTADRLAGWWARTRRTGEDLGLVGP